MVKRRMSIAIVIAMVMSMLSAVVPAYAAATAIDYVSINRSGGLNVGDVIEAVPTFTDEADWTEEVTYQWKRIKVENRIVGKNSTENNPYQVIEGATENYYTITADDVGFIIKAEATYNGKTVLSGDSVAVGNILSSYSYPALEAYSFKRFQNLSIDADSYIIGDLVYDETPKAHGGILMDSNNGDRYMNFASDVGGSGAVSYFGCTGNQLIVTESTLAEPVALESVLVESGYPSNEQAAPNVFVQVMYENETEYKDWSRNLDWGRTKTEAKSDAFEANGQRAKYNRIFFHYLTADADLTADDADKKVKSIKVIVCPEFGTASTDSIYMKEISAFARYESGLPEIEKVAGAEIEGKTVTGVVKGTRAGAFLEAITANDMTMTKTVVAEDMETEISEDSYIVDGMFVKLTSADGEENFYGIKNAADVFASDFNDYAGKRTYRVNNAVKGDGLPTGWTAVYSANPEAAATDKAEAKMYFEAVEDSVKGNAYGRLVNKDTEQTSFTNFQITKTGIDESLTKGNVVAFEINFMAEDYMAGALALHIGNKILTALAIDELGRIKVSGNSVREYKKNVWYNVLGVINIPKKEATFYINGSKVRDKLAFDNGIDANAGINRVNVTCATTSDGKAFANCVSFDDIKLYTVADDTYDGLNNKLDNTVKVNLASASAGIAYVLKAHKEATPLVSDVVSGFDSNYEVSVINPDNTVAALDAPVSEDMRIVFKNAKDDSALRMFKLEFKETYAPTFYTGNGSITKIADGTTEITARINMGDAEGVMLAALYEGDTLKNVAIGERIGSQLVAKVSVDGVENPEVGVILVQDMTNLVPMLSKMYTITK